MDKTYPAENRANNKEESPRRHYGALYAELMPGDAATRTGLRLEAEPYPHFLIEILGHTLRARWPEFALEPVTAGCPAALTTPAAGILIMRYLIRGERSAWTGAFLSYRELPWGEVYDSNFNGRCRIRLAHAFGPRLTKLCEAAKALGGTVFEQKSGSAGCDLPLPGGITVRLIVHEGDEEFPPSSQILFSDNVQTAWDAEDLAAMGELIISALREQ